jgi:acid phosphatase (class A)
MTRSLFHAAVLAAAFSLFSGIALLHADPASMAAPPDAPKDKKPVYVTVEQINVDGILPPPVADGSDRQKAELAELHHIQDTRTPAELQQAIADDKQEDIFIFASVFGSGFEASRFPQTAELGKQIRNDMSAVESYAKGHFARLRPWAIDPSIKGCPIAPNKPPNTSYPSGHASSGFALAVVLAAILPDRAADLLARARDYAEHRLVCGVHYRSDIVASEVLATVTVREMMHNEKFLALMTSARAELVLAGFSKK